MHIRMNNLNAVLANKKLLTGSCGYHDYFVYSIFVRLVIMHIL